MSIEAANTPGTNIAEMAFKAMNIKESLSTTLTIKSAPGLDTITVVLIDFGNAEGKAIIDCYGKAWGAFWGAMGKSKNPGQEHATVREFLADCDDDYLLACFLNQRDEAKQREKKYLLKIIEAVREALKKVATQK